MAHLLFVTPAFPPFTGGGERYTRALALALAEAGHQLSVVTSLAGNERSFWQGTEAAEVEATREGPLQIWRCPIRPFPGGWRGLLAWRRLMVTLSALPGSQAALLRRMSCLVPRIAGLETALAGQKNVDLVHAFNISWEHTLVAAERLARQRGVPYVVTPFAHLGETRRAMVARNSMMDHQRQILNKAAAVQVLTRVEAEGFRAWGVHPRQVDEVGSGLEPVPDYPTGVEQLKSLGAPQQTPFALFLGRVNQEKGAIHAVQAVNRLRGEGLSLALVLAGTVAGDFQRFFQSLPLAEQEGIHLLGPVDEASKQALLASAFALMLPSRTDSFGIVLLEAWAHGTPVIGAAAGGIAAVIDDGENGLLVPFGDVAALAAATRKLLEDEVLRRAMGQRGREKIARCYTWSRVRDLVVESYRQLGLAL